jgi:hypothetical protein
MLYLFSQARDNGKSVLHKGLGLMFKAGYVEGTKALNEKFNKALGGAVLVYLDEEKVSSEAGEKVKKYIEADNIILRLMRTDGFMYPNFSHWVAAYNFANGVPVEDGDERIIMIEVPTLYDEDKLDWKLKMRPALMAERTDFLGTLMTTELPPSGGRLYLPVLSTALKESVMSGKSGCDLKELLERVVAVAPFTGTSGKLAERLGPGSWTGSLNHLRRYLRKIVPKLFERGIKADLSDERLIVLNQVAP